MFTATIAQLYLKSTPRLLGVAKRGPATAAWAELRDRVHTPWEGSPPERACGQSLATRTRQLGRWKKLKLGGQEGGRTRQKLPI